MHITKLSPSAHIPLFLYPFLNTTSKTRPFEYLRLTSLGVIGALVKVRAFVPNSIHQPYLIKYASKMITTQLSISFYQRRLSLCAFASWRRVQSCPRPSPSSL